MDMPKNMPYAMVSRWQKPDRTPTGATTVICMAGGGATFPKHDFKVMVWPAAVVPHPGNAQILEVSSRFGNRLVIHKDVTVRTGDQIAGALEVAHQAGEDAEKWRRKAQEIRSRFIDA